MGSRLPKAFVEPDPDGGLAAEYRNMPGEERGRHLAAACRLAWQILVARPDASAVLERQEPRPEAWYRMVRSARGA